MLVICCGMPRSGSTLQFNIVWKVLSISRTGDKLEWRPANEWRADDAELRAAASGEKFYALKTHHPTAELKDIAQHSGAKLVYCHRDLRDVVHSMKVKFDFSTLRAIQRVSESLEVEKWLHEFAADGGSVLAQDYARLLHDLPGSVREVEQFFGIRLSDADRDAIVAELSIDNAYKESRAKTVRFEHLRRRVGRLLGRRPVFANEALMLHPRHVSEHKGQIGVWRDNLSARELSEIENAFGERLSQGFELHGN